MTTGHCHCQGQRGRGHWALPLKAAWTELGAWRGESHPCCSQTSPFLLCPSWPPSESIHDSIRKGTGEQVGVGHGLEKSRDRASLVTPKPWLTLEPTTLDTILPPKEAQIPPLLPKLEMSFRLDGDQGSCLAASGSKGWGLCPLAVGLGA